MQKEEERKHTKAQKVEMLALRLFFVPFKETFKRPLKSPPINTSETRTRQSAYFSADPTSLAKEKRQNNKGKTTKAKQKRQNKKGKTTEATQQRQNNRGNTTEAKQRCNTKKANT